MAERISKTDLEQAVVALEYFGGLPAMGAEGFHWGGHYQAASMPSILRSGAVGTAIFPPSLMFGIWPARHAS